MRIYKYICNNCDTVLSDTTEDIAKEHIMLDLKESGWVRPTKKSKIKRMGTHYGYIDK